jgi:phosphoglycolate phosphatase-like HAD superfamily hydrolase
MELALTTVFGVPADSGGVPYSGRTDRAIGRDLFRLHCVAETPQNWQRFLTAYLTHLPETLARHRGRILPGIAALLERLRSLERVTLGLLTGNIRDGARIKLGHFGLYEHFVFGGYGDDHFHRDDVAREALTVVHRHLNGAVDLEELWVIGDTPLDVSCARAIGARAVAVGTGWHSMEELAASQPDLLLTDLSDPRALLEQIKTASR